VIGPVERILTLPNGVKAYAGLCSDPFFFDTLGFRATNSTGNFQMRMDRDFFFDQNDTVIVVSIPLTIVGRDTNGDGRVDNRIDVWVDAFRKGGQLQ